MNTTKNLRYYLAGSVAIITFVVYLASLRNDFVNWDDNSYIIENPYIRSFNIDFLRFAFFDFYASNWHPLTWISHAIDYAIWGLNPLGHHLTSVILHAVNTFLVVLLIMRLQETAKGTMPGGREASVPNERGMLITAGVTGLLFGLHPVHVESVAWIAERKDLLCALFFLLSIAWYVKYATALGSGPVDHPVRSRFVRKEYLLSLCFFMLALMSKPMAVSLPVVLLLLDWYPLRRLHSGTTALTAFVEKLPFITFSLISSILTVLAQRAGGAFASMDVIPLSTRLLAAARAVVIYLWKMIMPVDLLPFYQYPRHVTSFILTGYFLAAVMVIGITVLCVILAKKNKLLLSVWGYYCITLLPVLGIVQVGSQFMADRYTYLPSLGPFLVFGLVLAWLSGKMRALSEGRLIVVAGNTIAILAAVSMTYLTIRQIGIWENSFVFWNHVITKEPEKVPIAYYGLGTSFQQAGLYDRAIENYDKAITLDASLYQVYNNKGALYGILGQYGKAIECLNKAIAIHPNSSAYNNRGLTLYFVGQYDNALEDYNRAIELDQRFADAYFNRGSLYLITGKAGPALFDFQKGCALGNRKSCNALSTLRTSMTPDQNEECFFTGDQRALKTAGQMMFVAEEWSTLVTRERV